jgi:poly(A) polymerase
VRFAARFELQLEAATRDAIRTMAGQISVVSAERIADEFRKMLTNTNRARAMELLWDVGLIGPLLPELLPMKGLPQGPPESAGGDLWDHVMKVLGHLEAALATLLPRAKVSFPLAFAALLHDVGKPRTVERLTDRYTFHGHEHVGRRLAAEICLRFRLSNVERERVEWLVEKHQYLCDAQQMKPSKLKVVLAHPGIIELLALHLADARATNRDSEHVAFCARLLQHWSRAELNPPALITGDDLIKMGLEPGPHFKEILDRVREAQLDGSIATWEEANKFVKQILGEKEAKQ